MEEPLSPDQIFISKLTDIVLANLNNENFGVKELTNQSGLSYYNLSQLRGLFIGLNSQIN